MLSTAMIASLFPATAFASETDTSNQSDEELINEDTEYVEGEVLVLYKDGEVTTDSSKGSDPEVSDEFGSFMKSMTTSSTEKKSAAKELDQTLPDQKSVLKDSLGSSYVVEDTIVLNDEDAKSDEAVISEISSEKYSTEELVEKLSENDAVEIVQPNYIYEVADDLSDTYASKQWYLDQININKVWDTYDSSTDEDEVVVAVLDTGVDYTHEDLADIMWENPLSSSVLVGEYGYDFVDGEADPMDDVGHGTHCAGIIAAQMNNSTGLAGVASKAGVKIMALDIIDSSGSVTTTANELQAFYYIMRACENGVNVRAMNCSYGGLGTGELECEVINELADDYGVVGCIAAGNEMTNTDFNDYAPGGVDGTGVLTVAATNESGELAGFSNYGEKTVDVAAPGTNILSTVSYNSYFPYIYDATTLASNSYFYGEASGCTVEDNVATLTTAENVGTFDSSVMKTNDTSGEVSMTLTNTAESTLEGEDNVLSWTISNPTAGKQYLLAFPFDHADLPDDCVGELLYQTNLADDQTISTEVGDIVYYNQSDYLYYYLDDTKAIRYHATPSSTSNGIWRNVSTDSYYFTGRLYTDDEVSKVGSNYSAGMGILVTANSTDDITININNVAISGSAADYGDSFGQYDLLSGTSMATPVVTGTVAMLAAANPSASAAELCEMVRGNVDTTNNLPVATSGEIDFSSYTADSTAQAVITSATVDTSAGTVTLSGSNLGETAGSISCYDIYNETTSEVSSDQITWGDSEIVISNADLIGNNIKFTVTTDSYTISYADYLVKGMGQFEFAGTVPTISDENDDTYYNLMPVNGSDKVRGIDYMNGKIYKFNIGDSGSYTLEADPTDVFDDYDYASKWGLNDSFASSLEIESSTEGVYSEGIIYEVLKLTTSCTKHYLLVGYNTSKKTWKVYYDDYGKSTAQNPFAMLTEYAMTVYDGWLYIFGGYGTEDRELSDCVYAGQLSKASSWTTSGMKVATLPNASYHGRAIATGGKIYYGLGYEGSTYLSENLYCYNIAKKTCALYTTLPDIIRTPEADADYLEATLGLYEDGIIVSGLSFEGAGDLLYLNTSKKTITPAYMSMKQAVINDYATGCVSGDKLYLQAFRQSSESEYDMGVYVTELSGSGYSNLSITKAGKGNGSISGDTTYANGETVSGTITANSNSFIKKVVIDGKTVKSATAKSKLKSYTYSFSASKETHTIKVTFGKFVSKVKFTKKKKKIKAGKSFKFKATTNGTNTNVRWKVSNKKYAKITSKGKFTAKKKGKGKTVKVTAISKENSKYKKSIKVKIK